MDEASWVAQTKAAKAEILMPQVVQWSRQFKTAMAGSFDLILIGGEED